MITNVYHTTELTQLIAVVEVIEIDFPHFNGVLPLFVIPTISNKKNIYNRFVGWLKLRTTCTVKHSNYKVYL